MPLKLIRRDGSDNWYIRGSVRGTRVFESTGTSDKEYAEAIRVKREARILEESVHGAKATVTFVEAASSYLDGGGSIRFLGRQEGTRWTGLVGHFGARKLRTIGQADLDEAARKLLPNASQETRNRQCYTPFIAIWNHAARNGWADERTWRRPRKPKGTALKPAPKRAGTRPISYDDAAKFVSSMSPAPGWAMTILFYTGMRPIELFALEGSEIDIARRWMVVASSKTGAPRGVPMHEFITPLMSYLKERGDPIIRTPRGPAYPLTEDGGGQMKSAVLGATKRSGIRDVSPYTARHTVSTQLVINGVHPHAKDEILGHAVTDMSRHYTRVPQANLIAAINTLPVPEAWRDIWWMRNFERAEGRLVRWGKSVHYSRASIAQGEKDV